MRVSAHTITPTTVVLVCSECSVGHYYGAPGVYTHLMHGARPWTCSECGHVIDPEWDVELEEGEFITTTDTGALAYVTTD